MGMKVMKAMKKTMRVSKIAKGSHARAVVFAGGKEKTVGGLTKQMLVKNKRGKIVSKKARAAGLRNKAVISKWSRAFSQAKKALGLTGFLPCGGKTAVGKALYAKTKSIYEESKAK